MSSNITYGPIVPEGQYPPFTIVTPDNHTAWIVIAAALGLICSTFFGGLRVLVRVTISREFGLDDFALFGATGFTILQSSIVMGACSKGLGKALSIVAPNVQVETERMFYASNLFFILAIGLSKISVVCFLQRLSPNKRHKLVFNIVLGILAVWTVASLFSIALDCNLSHPWVSIGEDCSGTYARWQAFCALDIITEVAIVGLALYLVWSLKSSWSNKILVVAIFSFRLLLIVPIAFRLAVFDEAGWTTNPFIDEAMFIAWSQGEVNYSLISATIPTFQNFLKNLNTQFGGLGDASAYGYGSGNDSRAFPKGSTTDYQMSKLRSANKSSAMDEEADEQAIRPAPVLRVPSHGFNKQGSNGDRNGSAAANGERQSLDSNESRQLMIKKDITWKIVTEDR